MAELEGSRGREGKLGVEGRDTYKEQLDKVKKIPGGTTGSI